MSNFSVTFEKEELNKWLDHFARRHRPELAEAVRKTAIKGVEIAKRELPGKSGNLKRSLLAQKNNDFSYLVWHGRNAANGRLVYADVLEVGTRSSYKIYPKRRKSLLIPLDKKVLTKGGQIRGGKSGPKERLFRELDKNKKRKKGKKLKRWDIFRKVGLAVLKPGQPVTIPKKQGQYIYRDRIKPKVLNHFKLEIYRALKQIGYTG